MNIETLRNLSKIKINKFILHIGEENSKFWFENYQHSNFQKIFWTSTNFYKRNYDISAYEKATVSKYQNPWYYFLVTKLKDNGLLSEGIDESYRNDMNFRYTFDTEQVNALVLDANINKKEDYQLFFEKAQTTLNLLNLEMIYVRREFENIIEPLVKKNNLMLTYTFDINMNKTLNQIGNETYTYNVYLKQY